MNSFNEHCYKTIRCRNPALDIFPTINHFKISTHVKSHMQITANSMNPVA